MGLVLSGNCIVVRIGTMLWCYPPLLGSLSRNGVPHTCPKREAYVTVSGVLAVARQLNQAGINVIPAVYRDKRPALTSWEKYQQEKVPPLLVEKWFGGSAQRNLLVVCGTISRLLVLDLDNRAAGEWWRQFPGMSDAMDATTCVKTGKGYHFWFQLDDHETLQSIQVAEDGRKFDLRCQGGLVIGPGSIHESGKEYRWVRDLSYLQPLPEAVRSFYSNRNEGEDGSVRSLFVDLIQQVPQGEGEGRNDWLARVAGHLAKWIPHRDAYEAMVYFVNDSMPEPLDEQEEVDKLVRSIWKGHQQRHTVGSSSRPSSPETGWLEGNGWQLFTTIKMDGDEAMAPWTNFDVKVLGIINHGEERSFQVEVHLVQGRVISEHLVDAEILTNPTLLAKWCGNLGLCFLSPPGDRWGRLKRTDRLYNYISSQEAPESSVVDHLGWVDGTGFVTHEGVLTREGMLECGGFIPHPNLVGRAPYRYGFVAEAEAQAVLRETMTFHDETVCAVFGAWWAACWLKAQIMARTALFPFMALEAASESGKTTGFFSLMIQLNGNTMGHGESTSAGLRDFVASHRNGIVWVDDMSDPTEVMDLLRQATAEGTRTKKGQNRTSQETIRLLAPVVISGEGFDALATEKALRDRAIILDVPSPTGRMSSRNPERPQWDDILALKAKYGNDLTKVAGTLGGMALESGDLVQDLAELRVGKGRWADKMAVLRVGARMIERLTGEDKWVDRVDGWTGGLVDPGAENLLTTVILPALLLEFGIPTSAKGDLPVFVDPQGQVWFHEEQVARHWARLARTPRQRQLGGLEAIRSQRRALGIEGSGKRLRTGHTGDGRTTWGRYHGCDSGAAPGWHGNNSEGVTGLSAAILARVASGHGLPEGQDEESDTLL